MRKIFLTSIIISLLCIAFGCKKENIIITDSTWTLNDSTYKGDSTYWVNGPVNIYSPPYLTSVNPNHTSDFNDVSIFFSEMPVANGIFAVVSPTTSGIYTYSAPISNTECYISVFDLSHDMLYTSTGVSGDKINISFSGGKTMATFSNVHVANKSFSGTITNASVSGSLITN